MLLQSSLDPLALVDADVNLEKRLFVLSFTFILDLGLHPSVLFPLAISSISFVLSSSLISLQLSIESTSLCKSSLGSSYSTSKVPPPLPT